MSAISQKKQIDYKDIERYYKIKEETTLITKKKKCKKQGNILQFKYFIYAVIIFSLALGIIFNYATITQRKMEINDLNKEITLIEKQKEDILIMLETIKNSNTIEQNAMNFLGMDYAGSTQNNFISVNYSGLLNDEFAYKDRFQEGAFLDNIIEKTILIFAKEGM
jgi:cell division protein FtsL